MVQKINETNPHARWITRATEFIKGGEIIIFPTDTNYVVACDIFNNKAVKKLYQVANRNSEELLSCICYDFSKLSEYAVISTACYRLLKKYLPGPYTFILKGKKILPKLTLTKRKTIGVRMPDNNICRAISCELENPMLITHVGTNKDYVDEPEELQELYKNESALMLLSKPLTHNTTTVIDLSDDDDWIFVKQGLGSIDLSDLR